MIFDKPQRPPPSKAAGVWRFPSLSDRMTINGRTGSGKTVAGAWLLSEAPFDKIPYIIVDCKGEKLFSKIQRIKTLDINEAIPDAPGLYITRPLPHQKSEVTDFLWRVWGKQNTGLLFDEGYLIPDSDSLSAIYTTGRSRNIPVFTLSQRPSWVSRFAFSEADFYQTFHLNDKRDHKTVSLFTPDNSVWDFERRLPKWHSRWYDVAGDGSAILGPVPDMPTILRRFDVRLTPKRRFL